MKKIIRISIIILLIITIIIVFILINYHHKEEKIISSDEGKSDPIVIENKHIIIYPDNRSDYFMVDNIVNNYMNYIVGNETVKLLDMLPQEYLDINNITENNVLSFVKDSKIVYSTNYDIIINEMYLVRQDFANEVYFVKLSYFNGDNNLKYKTDLIVQLDRPNSTFQILPNDYVESQGYDKLKVGDYCNIKEVTIKPKKYNKFNLVPISRERMPEKYFDLYCLYAKRDLEGLYNLLDKEYREKKFGDIDSYRRYIALNNLENRFITKYKINEYNNFVQYICVDSEGDYYIFNEYSIMNFKVILDTYTINLPEFMAKYKNATEQEKVALNVEKFINAVNGKDYNYSYNCLADSFKNNYFKTQQDFENYVQMELNGNYEIIYNNFKKEGNLFSYSVTLTDKKIKQSKQKTFIVKLEEETNFVLSFDR